MKFVRKAAIQLSDKTFTGHNHAACIAKMKRDAEQGFLIDDYSGTYFAGREEALEIAKKAGQIVHKHNPQDELLSEDMHWDNQEQRFLVGSELC